MKTIKFFSFVVMCLFITSCSMDRAFHLDSKDSPKDIRIAKAQEYFESRVPKSRTADEFDETMPTKTFDLGDKVPLWDEAIVSESNGIEAVDVPFMSFICLKVKREKIKGDTTKLYSVSAWQKLVVLTEQSTGKQNYIYATLIPTREYYRAHKQINWSDFVHFGNKSNYSGHVVYTDGESHAIIWMEFYRDGVYKYGATAFGCEESRKDRFMKLNAMISGMRFEKFTTSMLYCDWESNCPCDDFTWEKYYDPI